MKALNYLKDKVRFPIAFVRRSFERFLGGHINIFNITIFGRNAMHWGVDIRFKTGYLCFRLPLFCFGKWWPLYIRFSPDATPVRAIWQYGGDKEYRRSIFKAKNCA
jgi:hypothetical protein